MNHEELFKSKFFWVFIGWVLITAIGIGFIPNQLRQNVWWLSAVVSVVWLFLKDKLEYYTLLGSVMFGPIILLTNLTIYYDWIGKIDNWIRE